jgi:hypothetical protein
MSLNANNKPVYAITPINSSGSVSNTSSHGTIGVDSSSSPTPALIVTASASGSRVYSLIATNSDSHAVDLLFYILDGSNVYPIGIVNIPASAGNATNTLAVDCLSSSTMVGLPYDNTGKPYIELKASAKLKAVNLANQTAGSVYITAMGADYQ